MNSTPAFGQIGMAPPKRSFLDTRAASTPTGGEQGYGASYPVPQSPHQPIRPNTGNNRGGLGGTATNNANATSASNNNPNKMVVSPVPPSHAALTAQGGGPKTTEAVLLVEHKVELTDILHESLSLLDNVYRTKQIFGEHLRYVDPSFSGDAVQRMNLLTPPTFDMAYQHSIGANMAFGLSGKGGEMTHLGSGIGAAPQQAPVPRTGSQQDLKTAGADGGAVGGGSLNAGNNSEQAQQAAATEKKLRQRIRTAEVFVKKLYNRTTQLDTEVAFFKDELKRMQTLCGLSRAPAASLSVTDGHQPLDHPLYAPKYRRRCRSAPPTRTLLRTAIGGYGLRFPFGKRGSGEIPDPLDHTGGAQGSHFTNISQNPFTRRKAKPTSQRRSSGPFNNASEEEEEEESEEDREGAQEDEATAAFNAASTDAANAAVQGMRRRILQLTEAVVMLQQENGVLRTEKANRLTYRDALLSEYIVTRDRALAQLRASLQDAVTKVNNPMRLLRARQPNPGTNPAVATNNIMLEVYQRLATEINALVGDIVSGGSAAIANTNAVLLANGAGARTTQAAAPISPRDPAIDGDYEDITKMDNGPLKPIGQRAPSRSTIPLIEVGRVSSRPGTSGGTGLGGTESHLQLPLGSVPVSSRRVSGSSALEDATIEGGYTAAGVAHAGNNNYLLTCHGCGTCVPLATTAGGPGGVATIHVVNGGAGLALVSGGVSPRLGGGEGSPRARVAEAQFDALAYGGGPSAMGSANATVPISCGLTQSAAKRRELLTRLKPIVDALPLQRKKQLLGLMCELRHLFDCLVLSHRTLLTRYDDDRKESHRQMVQLQVNGSLLRDQIGELEQRLAAITAAAQQQATDFAVARAKAAMK